LGSLPLSGCAAPIAGLSGRERGHPEGGGKEVVVSSQSGNQFIHFLGERAYNPEDQRFDKGGGENCYDCPPTSQRKEGDSGGHNPDGNLLTRA